MRIHVIGLFAREDPQTAVNWSQETCLCRFLNQDCGVQSLDNRAEMLHYWVAAQAARFFFCAYQLCSANGEFIVPKPPLLGEVAERKRGRRGAPLKSAIADSSPQGEPCRAEGDTTTPHSSLQTQNSISQSGSTLRQAFSTFGMTSAGLAPSAKVTIIFRAM